jgi:hypothetical protein
VTATCGPRAVSRWPLEGQLIMYNRANWALYRLPGSVAAGNKMLMVPFWQGPRPLAMSSEVVISRANAGSGCYVYASTGSQEVKFWFQAGAKSHGLARFLNSLSSPPRKTITSRAF